MMAVLGIFSCSKDLYDESQLEELNKAQEAAKIAQRLDEYKANFIKAFGEISPNQSWDFSTYDVEYFTGSPSQARTRKPGDPLQPQPKPKKDVNYVTHLNGPNTPWYKVPDNTFALMGSVYGEGHNNTDFMKGTYFKMYVPDNDFYILPIFMGQSGGNFQLVMYVDGYKDKVVWDKWQDIEYKEKQNGKMSGWTKLDRGHSRGGYNLVGVDSIRTKPIKISVANLTKGAEMYFYLLITETATGDNHKDYNQRGDKLGCINGYIKEYEFKPGEVDLSSLPYINANSTDPVECKFFGCEDSSTDRSDNDYNDVIFLSYGQPHVPNSDVVDSLYREESKRYMIEDLGLADDRDFNDIVVDVIETFSATVKRTTSGTPLAGNENPVWTKGETRAEIRALGGTLDFELKIGTTTWKKSDDFDPKSIEGTTPPNENIILHTIKNVQGYDAKGNNVEVTVYQEDGETPAIKVNFPEDGSVPLMIATDTKTIWASERAEFPFGNYKDSAGPEKE